MPTLRSSLVVGAILVGLAVGVLLVMRRAAVGPTAPKPAQAGAATDDRLLAMDPEDLDLLLEDWRWMVGPDAKVLAVSIFGDLFIQGAGGRIHWLDTGRGRSTEIAESAEAWRQALAGPNAASWFHAATLRELRALEVERKPGDVYSWQHLPMLGGTESVDNVDIVSAAVHVSSSGRAAEAIKDLPPGTPIDHIDFQALGLQDPERPGTGGEPERFTVVINDELQYSIWPEGEAIPEGWKSAGKSGTQQECLEYIKDEVWTDMRPR